MEKGSAGVTWVSGGRAFGGKQVQGAGEGSRRVGMSGGDLRGHGGHSEDSGFTYTDMKPQEKDAICLLALGSDSSHEPSSLSPAS